MSDYDAIYSQDTPAGEAHGWIQWKGTNVCMDMHCVCGYAGHFDGDFFYHYECPKCHAKYAVGQVVKLIPLTPAQAQDRRFQTCELEDDDEAARPTPEGAE